MPNEQARPAVHEVPAVKPKPPEQRAGSTVHFMEHAKEDSRPAVQVGDWQKAEWEAAGYVETDEAQERHAKQCKIQADIDLRVYQAAQEALVRKRLMAGR